MAHFATWYESSAVISRDKYEKPVGVSETWKQVSPQLEQSIFRDANRTTPD